MIRAIKGVVRRAIGATGYELRRKPPDTSGTTFDNALARLRLRGESLFNTVIDVGASDGRWSQSVLTRFPAARCLLIEAQPVHEADLKAFCARHPTARYVLAAAGEAEGFVHFDAADPFGGAVTDGPAAGPASIRAAVTTIDRQVRDTGLPPPYLIKLDVHGYELPILKGAAQVLAQASVCVIECYNFPMAMAGSLRFPELCLHLESLGFRCADLYDPMFRPADQLFWQVDFVFLRADRPEFAHLSYR